MADNDDVRATTSTARAVPIRQQPAKGFTKDEFYRWARENPQTLQRLAEMPLSEAGLLNQVNQEIAQARVGWLKQPASTYNQPIGPRPDRPSEFRVPGEIEPGYVQVTGPDGTLYTISEETYEWAEGQRRRAVAMEYIENAAGALAGMPQRYSPAPPPSTRPTITQVERGIIRPPASPLPRMPRSSPRAPAQVLPTTASVPELPLTIPRDMSRTAPPPSTRQPITQVERGLARPPAPPPSKPPSPRAPSRVPPPAVIGPVPTPGQARHMQPAPPGKVREASQVVRQLEYDGRLAGTNGVRAIGSWVNGLNQTIVEIYGEVLPALTHRHRFENTLPLASTIKALEGKDYDRAHLWGRAFGDEAAAGIMYAPNKFNTGAQRVLEETIRGIQTNRKPGERIVLKARATSFDRSEPDGGTILSKAEYDFRVVDATGSVIHRTVVRFDINEPKVGGWSKSVWSVDAPVMKGMDKQR